MIDGHRKPDRIDFFRCIAYRNGLLAAAYGQSPFTPGFFIGGRPDIVRSEDLYDSKGFLRPLCERCLARAIQ